MTLLLLSLFSLLSVMSAADGSNGVTPYGKKKLSSGLAIISCSEKVPTRVPFVNHGDCESCRFILQ